MKKQPYLLGVIVMLAGTAGPRVQAEDWPTYRHDNRRSGVSSESLNVPLSLDWQVQSPLPPQPAWTGPAKWDSYANMNNLKPMRNFDPVFYTVVARGRVYFSSSVDHGIHCLDLESGREIWTFFTNGPVRVAPTIAQDRLFSGSDDGQIYCLNPLTGTRQWTYRPATEDKTLVNNGHLISTWPCRTGVLVQDDIVYAAASLLPWEATYICALDANTGKDQGRPGLYNKTHAHMTAQGPLLASARNVYISQGRQAPLIISRDTGELQKNVGRSGFGGVFGLLTEDDTFVHGHGQNHGAQGELRVFDKERHDLLMTYPKATVMVIHQDTLYVQAEGQLQALQRGRYLRLQSEKHVLQTKGKDLQSKLKKIPADQPSARAPLERDIKTIAGQIKAIEAELPRCVQWRTKNSCSLDLILVGDTLYAGGVDRVVAHEARTGNLCWQAEVPGRAFGLTAAQGRLLVSTDQGTLLCFQEEQGL